MTPDAFGAYPTQPRGMSAFIDHPFSLTHLVYVAAVYFFGHHVAQERQRFSRGTESECENLA
jgi:hypothetical protein